MYQAPPSSLAELRDGALVAQRRAAATDLAAQFHKRLVEAADFADRQHGLCRRPEQLLPGGGGSLPVVGQEPAEDADRIGLQDRPPLVESDGEHRASRIAADARQPQDGVGIGGKTAAMLGDDPAGGRVQLPRAAVVAQSLP